MGLGAAVLSTILLLVFCLFPAAGASGAETQNQEHLNQLPLEELLDLEMEVVTASRRTEPASLTAAAVTVLDAEAIMRTGATTLPDVLRRIPSLHVTRTNTDSWNVSVRGFSGLRNSTLLVMVDGRPVTSPSLAGVLWSDQAVPVETIQRIEVVRGPCTSLWGLDSFNGVVNVITKRAEDAGEELSVTTVGTAGVGQLLLGGGEAGESGHWRAYTGLSYDPGTAFDGNGRGSRYWAQQGTGFRADFSNNSTDETSLQGGIYSSSISQHLPTAAGDENEWRRTYHGHMQWTWDRATGLDTGIRARTSYTRARETFSDAEGIFNVVDGEVQHSFHAGSSQHLVMGLGTRYIWDEFDNGDAVRLDPAKTARWDWNAFIQDRIKLPPDGLDLILGIKFDKTGSHLEPQPTARMLYDQGENVFWTAVSRAVRSSDQWGHSMDVMFDFRGKTYDVTEGDDLKSEELVAWEAGWRRPGRTLSMDLALYVNQYDDMLGMKYDTAGNKVTLNNDVSGTTMGLEYSLSWIPAPGFMLVPSLNYIHHSWNGWVNPQNGTGVPKGDIFEPHLQAYYDLTDDISLNATLLYTSNPPLDHISEVNMDAGISWQARSDLRLDLSGENLFGSRVTMPGRRQDPAATMRLTWTF